MGTMLPWQPLFFSHTNFFSCSRTAAIAFIFFSTEMAAAIAFFPPNWQRLSPFSTEMVRLSPFSYRNGSGYRLFYRNGTAIACFCVLSVQRPSGPKVTKLNDHDITLIEYIEIT